MRRLAPPRALVLLLLGVTAVGVGLLLRAPADMLPAAADEIAASPWCPHCEARTATVAEATNEFARAIRQVIEQKVAVGESRADIVRYFTDRYGDRIVIDRNRDLAWRYPLVGAGLLALLYAGLALTRPPRRASHA